jgi:hypothetical protein
MNKRNLTITLIALLTLSALLAAFFLNIDSIFKSTPQTETPPENSSSSSAQNLQSYTPFSKSTISSESSSSSSSSSQSTSSSSSNSSFLATSSSSETQVLEKFIQTFKSKTRENYSTIVLDKCDIALRIFDNQDLKNEIQFSSQGRQFKLAKGYFAQAQNQDQALADVNVVSISKKIASLDGDTRVAPNDYSIFKVTCGQSLDSSHKDKKIEQDIGLLKSMRKLGFDGIEGFAKAENQNQVVFKRQGKFISVETLSIPNFDSADIFEVVPNAGYKQIKNSPNLSNCFSQTEGCKVEF